MNGLGTGTAAVVSILVVSACLQLASFPLARTSNPRQVGTCSLPLRPELHAPQEVMKARGLFQPCVLRLGFPQDGNIRVGVFPDREEILIGGAGLGSVALHGVSTRQSDAGQRTPGKVHHQSSVVDESLKFRCRSVAVAEHEIGFPAQIDRAQQYREVRR